MSPSLREFHDDAFSGSVRLFPLPGLVMFPHVVQALHIFEPRYRQLLADALDDDQLIAMATLADGWQGEYDGQPPVHSEICIGQISSHSMLDDGCSNILLVGLRRARIVTEVDSDRLYRVANAELLHDHYAAGCDETRSQLQLRLLTAFKELMPKSALMADQLVQAMGKESSLGMLTDLIGFSLKLPMDIKQQLLGQCNVDARAEFLLDRIAIWDEENRQNPPHRRPGFPPDFSAN